jgi:hypothetical protein
MDKEQVITIAQSMGFVLDYDQWDVEGKEWLRFHFKGYNTKDMCLIWWRYGEPIDTHLREAANIIYRAGQQFKVKQLTTYTDIE